MATEKIRLGIMVTSLSRRRPWMVVRETVSLEHLSNGRLILGVGLGDPAQWEYGSFGEDVNPIARAKQLDESLEILVGLWSGEPFQFCGDHYQLDEMVFLPTPLQKPRIPIWVGGFWPNKPPLRRAARYEGTFPGSMQALSPEDWRIIKAYIGEHRMKEG